MRCLQIVAPREVQHGEFTVQLDGLVVANSCRFFRGQEIPQVKSLSVCSDVCHPVSRCRVKTDADKPTRIVTEKPTVVSALHSRSGSQVVAAVVEGVMVYVIDQAIRWKTENFTVHPYGKPFPISALIANRIKTLVPRIPVCVPEVEGEPLVINEIDYGYHPASERDMADFRVVWLRDKRPLISTILAYVRHFFLECPALWARVVLIRALFSEWFGKIGSRLELQWKLVHVSPPSEMCGLAALLAF